jgi:hypothetical protein
MKLKANKPTTVEVDFQEIKNDVARFLKIYRGLGFGEYSDDDFLAMRSLMKLTDEEIQRMKND